MTYTQISRTLGFESWIFLRRALERGFVPVLTGDDAETVEMVRLIEAAGFTVCRLQSEPEVSQVVRSVETLPIIHSGAQAMTQNQIGFTLTKTGGQWVAEVDNLSIPAELSRWLDASFYGRRLELVVVLTPAGALAGVWVNRVPLPACPRDAVAAAWGSLLPAAAA